MNNFYKTELTISEKECSKFGYLRYDSVLNIFQLLAISHSYEMKVDRESLIESSNAFFVITKMKFSVSKMPKINEQVTAITWPIKVTSPIKFYRDYEIYLGGEVLVSGVAEWCTLDGTTRTLRKINSVKYPYELQHIERRSQVGEFTKLTQVGEYVTDYVVADSDIDVNGHTNNVSYVKIALSTYLEEEFEKANFKGLEVHFNKETMLGETINIYKAKTDLGDCVYGEINGKRIFAVMFEK